MLAHGVFRIVALVTAALATEARADLRFVHANDAFSDLDPPVDDDGFTTDLALAFWRPYRGMLVGGAVFDRWVTEQGGDRRCDQLELVATVERTWPRGVVSLTGAGRLGPTFTGNLGGRWMQNGWHALSGTGPTLDDGLQSDYAGGVDAGIVAGARGRAAIGSRSQGYAALDTQLAIATGVTFLDAALGGRAAHRFAHLELGAHVELAVQRFHVADDRLALRSGYRSGFEAAWRAGIDIAYKRIRFDLQYRANEGNSGEPIVTLAWTFKQAGARF
jgi:hypothetical protein